MAAKLIGERLPQNWSYAVTKDGRIFFIDDSTHQTTWLHPLTRQPVQTGHSLAQGLPPGWEQALTIDGTIYFIDHNRRVTTFEHPVTGQSVMEPPERTPTQSPLIKGSQNRKSGKSRNMKAPSASREENSKVILRGWLQKQESGGLRLWKKKWCVLADFGLFFYKDDNEQNCIGSILLPSYTIRPCGAHDVNKKHSFKAEHENMKTFYFAAENQVEMDKWVEALKMASLVQRAPGSGHVPKLIPKSPIMSWNDNIDSPGAVSPPDMQQYPFSGRDQGQGHETSRDSSSMNNSFVERSPLQSKENVPNYMDPYQRQRDQNGIPPGSFSSLPRDIRGQGQNDPRYPGDRLDTSRMSQRSNMSQGQSLPDEQRSVSSLGQRSGQFSSSTLPRDMRPGQLDPKHSQPPRGQGYNSLPRDQRGQGQGSRAPHERTHEYRDTPRREDNPYMMMSPHNQSGYERKMDPMKHSNRPLPEEPRQERPRDLGQHRGKSGGGDYASLTRVKDKWPNQQLADSGQPGSRNETPRGNHLSPTQQQRPDLYVDIPHTYVNVYDESQVRDKPPELPSRPPLPAEMRHKIVEDIAKSHSPNTQNDMLTSENNLELRMKQPPFFNYPTPSRETLPAFPQQQDSPRSQYSQRSQRSDQRSQQEVRGQPQLPRRPDVALESSVSRQEARNVYQLPLGRYGHNLNTSNLSDNVDGSTDTLTNEEDRNDKISEFYGLGKYNKGYSGQDKTRFMSDIDVRTNTLPSKPISGVTGEKDFRLRSLPDHVQSMPALYHEQQQPLSVQVPGQEPAVNSYMNLAPASGMQNGHSPGDQDQRKSAFRPLSSNSLQRVPSTESHPSQDRHRDYRELGRQDAYPGQGHARGYPGQGRPGDLSRSPNYTDLGQTNVKGTSPRNYPMSSQNKQLPWRQEKPVDDSGQGQSRGQGQRGHRAPPIQTVKEDEDMPDSQVIETQLPKRVFPLNGPRLRMSISATDLLGKTHDELVLLLIQLRRDKTELTEQRNGLRKMVEQNRPAEFYYRKLQNEGRPIDGEKEVQHRKYQDLKHRLEDVENKLEVYKPLVNLVCNMVTMGSLYGGDNLMLATEYRKHLLSPDQYSPPKKMLEFSRKHQEDQVVQEIEDEVKQLTQEQADLEKELVEKLNRLYELDKIMQEQSFQVTSLKEDREMLERALGGLLKKQDQHCTNPRELDKLLQQQKTIEKELSRVLQQLAEASKELEETTAENNKLEHEVALLRSKVHGNVSRSKSAPSLSSESLRTKMKMEKDLARVKNIMAGLSEEGARLQEMMSTLRKPKPLTGPTSPTSPSLRALPRGIDQKDGKKSDGGTYYETDLDNGQSKDLAQVTALLASYHLLPNQTGSSPEPLSHRSDVGRTFRSPPPSSEEGTSAFRTVSPSRKEDDTTYHASLVQATFQPTDSVPLESGVETDGAPDQWDIGEADDNTKRFFGKSLTGLIPKNMPKQQTVRDVKRISDSRKDGKKKEEDTPPLQVGVIPSEYNETTHVYENLPQQKSVAPTSVEQKPPWAALLKDGENSVTGTQRRRSNLHLIAPKPFSLNSKPRPYSSVNNISSASSVLYNSQSLDQSDAPLHNHNTQDSQSQDFSDKLNKFESSQSNDSYKPTEPMKTQNTSKTPPPPPVRGTSRYLTADSAQLESLKELFKKSTPNRNFETPEPAILKRGRSGQKTRYLTISSSEPIRLEKSSPTSPKHHSQAGELISSMEVPDIVKSSTTKYDMYDERTIDRELWFPEKVEIPERYIPDSDDESVTEEEKARRQEKANKIKKILTQQSVHSLSQPDVSKVAGEVHERVQQEKQQRALLLGISQELAEQVKRKSRQYAAERRKTWSGTTNKSEVEQQQRAESDDDEHHGNDANNNSYIADDSTLHDSKNVYHSEENSFGKHPAYTGDVYSGNRHLNEDSRYYDTNYTATSYLDRPNFKI